jgi:hypothetical protein
MASVSTFSQSLPTSVIFLDIDEVLIIDRTFLIEEIQKKIKELFVKKEDNGKIYLLCGYTELEWRIAASHFFLKSAVDNLDKLIEKVSKVAKVSIVLCSNWRLDGDIKEIQERMFSSHSFSKFIIDKTPDPDWWRRKFGQEELSPIALKKYGFELDSRGSQIDFWLRENQGKFNVKSFVILDDDDEGVSKRFPKNFVKVKDMLSDVDIEKAYKIMTETLIVPLSLREERKSQVSKV